MKTILLLWTEFWAEESSLVYLGIAPSQASRAKSKHLRDSINFLAMPTGKGAWLPLRRGLHQPHGRPGALCLEHVVFVCARGRKARCVVRFLPAVWRGGLRPALQAVVVQPPHRAMAPVSPGRRHDWHVLHYDIGCARDARTRQGANWWRVMFLDIYS
jgi:hypothetical protein